MASPSDAAAPNGISTPPPTTTTSAPTTNLRNNASSPSTLTAQNTPSNHPPHTNAASSAASNTVPLHPRASTTDPGTTKRPRDQRILHLLLASMGVQAYEERVPLMLQDFAYRYQVSILADALALTPDNHTTAAGGEGGGKGGKNAPPEATVSQMAIRQAINSRLGYQFSAALPKEWLLELAQERNRTALPRVEREFGVRLPHEKFCLTGTGWGLKENWESEEDDDGEGDGDVDMGEGDEGEGADGEGEEFEEVMGVRNEDAMEM